VGQGQGRYKAKAELNIIYDKRTLLAWSMTSQIYGLKQLNKMQKSRAQ